MQEMLRKDSTLLERWIPQWVREKRSYAATAAANTEQQVAKDAQRQLQMQSTPPASAGGSIAPPTAVSQSTA